MTIPEGTKTKTEFISLNLYDDDGNAYPSELEIQVNDFEVTVIGVICTVMAGIVANNPQDDIKDAIRNAGYKSQEIIF